MTLALLNLYFPVPLIRLDLRNSEILLIQSDPFSCF